MPALQVAEGMNGVKSIVGRASAVVADSSDPRERQNGRNPRRTGLKAGHYKMRD